MHLIAAMAKHFGSGQSGWPGANDANRFRPLNTRRGWLDPALGKGGFGDMFFNRTNGD